MSKANLRVRLVTLAALFVTMIVPLVARAAEEGSDTSAFTRYVGQGIGAAIGASFVFGILGSLTPCVFPMVPITVAIFGATESASRSRGSALSATFVLGIATLLTPLGVIAGLSGMLLGSALGNPWVVGAIALVFATLAASMFGAFEMALPSGLNNKLSSVGGVGFKGAFVIGLVMGLVAMPCTGPFLTGLLIWIGKTRNWQLGGGAMLAFSLGLGLPFFLAGAFAMTLPKGGAWMLGIKWVSGVALAYMALAYLRDAFPLLRTWIRPSLTYGVIGAGILLVGFALGCIHVAAERRRSSIAHLSKPTRLFSIVPAVAGAFIFITWYQMPRAAAIPETFADANMVPGGIVAPIAWRTKETDARAEAVAEKKPVLIDFGATWCKGCMEYEEQTWVDHGVQQEASRFVAIKVDASDDDAPDLKRLEDKYQVRGLPTVVVLDGSGTERIRFTEFVAPDRFKLALASVH